MNMSRKLTHTACGNRRKHGRIDDFPRSDLRNPALVARVMAAAATS